MPMISEEVKVVAKFSNSYGAEDRDLTGKSSNEAPE